MSLPFKTMPNSASKTHSGQQLHSQEMQFQRHGQRAKHHRNAQQAQSRHDGQWASPKCPPRKGPNFEGEKWWVHRVHRHDDSVLDWLVK